MARKNNSQDPSKDALVHLEGEVQPLVRRAVDVQVRDVEGRLAPVLAATRAIKQVRSREESEAAADAVAPLKEHTNAAERLRRAMVDPLNGLVKWTNTRFKEVLAPATTEESRVKGMIGAHYAEERRRAEEEAERLRKEQEKLHAKEVKKAEKKGWEAPPEPPAPVVAEPPKVVAGERGAVQIRRRWTFEVVDDAAVPRAYLIVDATLIRRAMQDDLRAGRDPREIPGVRFYQAEEVAV